MRRMVVAGEPSGESEPGWREELSKRVESFRKRRARLQQPSESLVNLELDFEAPSEPEEPVLLNEVRARAEKGASGFDADLGDADEASAAGGPTLEAILLEMPEEEKMPPVTSPEGAMEIVVGLPSDPAPGEEPPASYPYAPVGSRFLAGLTDALVLVVSAALFGIIFWRSGGHLTPNPLNLGVVAAVVIFLIFSYFGLFTALTSTTPGLLWMGCEIRSQSSGYPTARESAWRAFGILVSLSALMLGFIWAWVDSDGLTWHDRMSGTCITLAEPVYENSHPDPGR
jgi:uncharacterized RDD family membrane protein YckC